MLVLVDASEAEKPVLEISRQAMRSDFTLVLAWSPMVHARPSAPLAHRALRSRPATPALARDAAQEAARYLETFKAYARKPADMIQGSNDRAYMTQLTEALTTIRPVNKVDVATLHATFGSLASIMTASREELSHCPGLGERKVSRLLEAFDEPFIPRGATLPSAATGDDDDVGD